MFKWVEIALKNNRLRYEELSQFLRENNFENEVEFIAVDVESFPEAILQATEKYDGIRIGQGFGELAVRLFPHHMAIVDSVRVADAVVNLQGKWWLQANGVEGFSRVLRRVGDIFDLESKVLVVGAGAAARVAITSLFVAGFKQFAISALEESKVESFIESLKKTHFGVQFSVVRKDDLILLPGTHGVLVNTTPMTENNPLLEELYYFNFFKSGGVAIDFSISPVETPLLRGAKDVGARCLYGYQISAFTDLIWCEQVTGRQLPEATYENRLRDRLLAANPGPSA